MKAEANAEADKKKEREKIDKLNQADSMIFQTENMLKEQGDKIPADVKSEMEAAIQKLKDAHKAQDVAAIDAAIAELNAVAQKMYQAGAQPGAQPGPDMNGGFNGGAQAGGQSSQNGPDVQDADFEGSPRSTYSCLSATTSFLFSSSSSSLLHETNENAANKIVVNVKNFLIVIIVSSLFKGFRVQTFRLVFVPL